MLTMNPNITYHPELIKALRAVRKATESAMKYGRPFSPIDAHERRFQALIDAYHTRHFDDTNPENPWK